jgi:hypothetical protein
MAGDYSSHSGDFHHSHFFPGPGETAPTPHIFAPADHADDIMKQIGEQGMHPDTHNEQWRATWNTLDGSNYHLFSDQQERSSYYILDVWTLESEGQYRYRFWPQDQTIVYEHPFDSPVKDISQDVIRHELLVFLKKHSSLIDTKPFEYNEFDQVVAFNDAHAAVLGALGSLNASVSKELLDYTEETDLTLAASGLFQQSKRLGITVDESLFREAFHAMISQVRAETIEDDPVTEPLPVIEYPYKIEVDPKLKQPKWQWLRRLGHLFH